MSKVSAKALGWPPEDLVIICQSQSAVPFSNIRICIAWCRWGYDIFCPHVTLEQGGWVEDVSCWVDFWQGKCSLDHSFLTVRY